MTFSTFFLLQRLLLLNLKLILIGELALPAAACCAYWDKYRKWKTLRLFLILQPVNKKTGTLVTSVPVWFTPLILAHIHLFAVDALGDRRHNSPVFTYTLSNLRCSNIHLHRDKYTTALEKVKPQPSSNDWLSYHNQHDDNSCRSSSW